MEREPLQLVLKATKMKPDHCNNEDTDASTAVVNADSSMDFTSAVSARACSEIGIKLPVLDSCFIPFSG